MPTEQKTQTQRVPTPPTTRRQEEKFTEVLEESEQQPLEQAKTAIRQARRALQEAEDALDNL
jgi:hypothetical protein